VRAAKSAARSPRALSRGDDCSSEQTEGASSGLALLAIGTGLDAAEGNTPREALFPRRFPPLGVISEPIHLSEYPRTGHVRLRRARELQRELSPSQRSLAKETASAQPFEVFRLHVLRTVATTRLHIRATSSYLVGAGPDRRRLRASSKAWNWQE
jgi:hypothetical protein